MVGAPGDSVNRSVSGRTCFSGADQQLLANPCRNLRWRDDRNKPNSLLTSPSHGVINHRMITRDYDTKEETVTVAHPGYGATTCARLDRPAAATTTSSRNNLPAAAIFAVGESIFHADFAEAHLSDCSFDGSSFFDHSDFVATEIRNCVFGVARLKRRMAT